MDKIILRFRYVLGVLLATLILTSCSPESKQSFTELKSLRQALITEYSENQVNLTISNGEVLMVSFTNSSFNQLNSTEKKEKAREIAEFVNSNYPSIHKMRQVWVSFVVYKKILYLIDYTNSLNTYMFDTGELVESKFKNLTDEYEPVYIFKEGAKTVVDNFHNQSKIGIIVLASGIAWMLATIAIVLITKKKALLFLGLIALFPLCWGGGWLAITGTTYKNFNNNYKQLEKIYDEQEYQVTEGNVQVLHTQPRGGHDKGDVVKVDNVEFTIDYFETSLGYNKTIAYGGVLQEDVSARIYYTDDTILRIDLKAP